MTGRKSLIYWRVREWLPLQFPHVVLTLDIAGTFGNVLHRICTLTSQRHHGQT